MRSVRKLNWISVIICFLVDMSDIFPMTTALFLVYQKEVFNGSIVFTHAKLQLKQTKNSNQIRLLTKQLWPFVPFQVKWIHIVIFQQLVHAWSLKIMILEIFYSHGFIASSNMHKTKSTTPSRIWQKQTFDRVRAVSSLETFLYCSGFYWQISFNILVAINPKREPPVSSAKIVNLLETVSCGNWYGKVVGNIKWQGFLCW